MIEEKVKKEINPVRDKKPETSVISNGIEKTEAKKIGTNVSSNDKKARPVKTFKKNTHFTKKRRSTRPRSEFDQKIIKIRRVTRVVKGGRRFSFSVAIVIGNRKGSVGRSEEHTSELQSH